MRYLLIVLIAFFPIALNAQVGQEFCVECSASFEARTISVSEQLLVDDNDIFVDVSGGSLTITLPTAALIPGKEYYIQDIGSASAVNIITIDTQGAETINGVVSIEIKIPYGNFALKSDGINWFIKS